MGSQKDKRRKTKWNVEPMLTHMRKALSCIRVQKMSTTDVSKSFGIPTRTLRRYVNFSKDPEDKLFYMEVEEDDEEEEEQEEDHDKYANEQSDSEEENDTPISWAPQTTVPMFTIYTGDVPAVALQTQPETSQPEVHDSNNKAASSTSGLIDGVFSTTSDLFDCVEFDSLFQDFCHDLAFSDVL